MAKHERTVVTTRGGAVKEMAGLMNEGTKDLGKGELFGETERRAHAQARRRSNLHGAAALGFLALCASAAGSGTMIAVLTEPTWLGRVVTWTVDQVIALAASDAASYVVLPIGVVGAIVLAIRLTRP